jgi:AraC-like DNA-binding protein
MIWETKGMIAGCIERMRQSACGTCDRRDECAFHFPKTWQFEREQQPFEVTKHPFLAFLGEVAKAFEAGFPVWEKAEARPAPPSAFRGEIERHLESMLASGEVRIDQVARALGYSRQTLYRRLKAEGITFAELLDGLRHRLALRWLRDDRLSVKEVAYRLGFSDPAAFSRAFKRWTGQSPSAIRD